MNTFVSILTTIALSGTGDVKTGQMLGLCAQPFLEGLYEIDLDPGMELASLLFPFELNPSEGDLAVGPDGILYAAFSGSFDELVIIDPADGSLTFVGPFGFDDVSALAFAPDGTLYGHDDFTCQLISINVETGKGKAIGPVDLLGGSGLAFSLDGTLFACGAVAADDGPLAALFTVNVETGESTQIGLLSQPDSSDPVHLCQALQFVGDTLYASGTSLFGFDFLFTLSTQNGHATEVGLFDPTSTLSMGGLAFLPGRGDADRDGDVDFDDYNIFVSCFTGPLDPGGDRLPVGCVFLDSDDDNDIDCLDWEAFIVNWTEDEEPPTFEECDGPPPCAGDANGNGTVDPLDAGFVSARFGCPVGTGDPECDAADQTADGLVDPLDLGFVLARFGACP